VALLCVLLTHAWFIYVLWSEFSSLDLLYSLRGAPGSMSDDFESEPITLDLPPLPSDLDIAETPPRAAPRTRPSAAAARAPPAAESKAITDTSRVDWPIEGKKSAARVLAREAEAERIARMFAGPGGTWASLTKRQRSKLNKFRFKPGIDGLEYDSQGNQIFHISEGCVIVNSLFFGCALGKPKVHDDMFDNMRLYFDEQRLPETKEGNGTEPEALRPPY